MLARGEPPPGRPREDDTHRRTDWPDDLCEVVYIDHFGNAMTGLRALMLPYATRLVAVGRAWSPPGPSAIDPRARPSGTRIQTRLLKSLSIKGAPTANLVSRLAFRSRSSPCE